MTGSILGTLLRSILPGAIPVPVQDQPQGEVGEFAEILGVSINPPVPACEWPDARKPEVPERVYGCLPLPRTEVEAKDSVDSEVDIEGSACEGSFAGPPAGSSPSSYPAVAADQPEAPVSPLMCPQVFRAASAGTAAEDAVQAGTFNGGARSLSWTPLATDRASVDGPAKQGPWSAGGEAPQALPDEPSRGSSITRTVALSSEGQRRVSRPAEGVVSAVENGPVAFESRESTETGTHAASAPSPEVVDALEDRRTPGPAADVVAGNPGRTTKVDSLSESDPSRREVAPSAGSPRAKRADRLLPLESRQQKAAHQTDRATPGAVGTVTQRAIAVRPQEAVHPNPAPVEHGSLETAPDIGPKEGPRDGASGPPTGVAEPARPPDGRGDRREQIQLQDEERMQGVTDRKRVGPSLVGQSNAHIPGQATPQQGVRMRDVTGVQPPRVFSPEVETMIMDRIVREIRFQVFDRASEVRIRLIPEALGEVTMQVRMEEGRLTAQIDVTQPSVKNVLETGIGQLRTVLQQQGIDIDRIDIYASANAMRQESDRENSGNDARQQGERHRGETAPEARQAKFLGYNTIDITM